MKPESKSFQRYINSTNGSSVPGVYQQLDYYHQVASADELTGREEQVVDRLSANGSDMALYYAGVVSLDVASRSAIDEYSRCTWIQKTHENWTRLTSSASRSRNISVYAIQAAIGVETLPSFQTILLKQELPNNKIRHKMYDNLVQLGHIATSKLTETNKATKTILKRELLTALAGTVGELAVMLLHQRFTQRELDDGSQLALPSRFSEDRGGSDRNKGSALVRAWDISVFQQYPNEDITVPYRIQVKTNKKAHKKFYRYSDDISVININEDLTVGLHEKDKKTLSAFTIINEIYYENIHTERPGTSERLNARTQQLLDCIDEAEL